MTKPTPTTCPVWILTDDTTVIRASLFDCQNDDERIVFRGVNERHLNGDTFGQFWSPNGDAHGYPVGNSKGGCNAIAHIATASDIERQGFAKHNNGAHLAVQVPDGHFTVSLRLPDSNRITVTFLPNSKEYPAYGIAPGHDHVQILHHGKELDGDIPEQRLVIEGAMGEGNVPLHDPGMVPEDVTADRVLLLLDNAEAFAPKPKTYRLKQELARLHEEYAREMDHSAELARQLNEAHSQLEKIKNVCGNACASFVQAVE